MIYCNECGSITDGRPQTEMFEPGYGRTYMACSMCGGDDVEDAVQCPICGDYHRDGLKEGCSECREHIYKNYVNILEGLEMEFDPDRNRVLEIMSSVFEDFWEKYY